MGAKLFHADKHTVMMKLMVTLHNFVNVAKIKWLQSVRLCVHSRGGGAVIQSLTLSRRKQLRDDPYDYVSDIFNINTKSSIDICCSQYHSPVLKLVILYFNSPVKVLIINYLINYLLCVWCYIKSKFGYEDSILLGYDAALVIRSCQRNHVSISAV